MVVVCEVPAVQLLHGTPACRWIRIQDHGCRLFDFPLAQWAVRIILPATVFHGGARGGAAKDAARGPNVFVRNKRLSNPSCRCSGLQKRKTFLCPVSISPGKAKVCSLIYPMFPKALKQCGDAALLPQQEQGPMHVRQGFTSSSHPSMRHCALYPGQAVVEHVRAVHSAQGATSFSSTAHTWSAVSHIRCHLQGSSQRRCHLLQGAAGA
jgi:hypothetical protein